MNDKNKVNVWKVIAIAVTCLLLLMSYLYYDSINKNQIDNNPEEDEIIDDEENISYLSLWNDNAEAKIELENYIKDITDENNPDYIPIENRVAVFDLDGTLFCETDPVYFDHMLFMHRVLEDPSHTASEFELEVAKKVQEFIDTGVYPEGLDNLHGQGVASAFKGMTLKEFSDYVAKYAKTECPGYNNMNREDAFYLPMVEIIDLLQNNDFKVYIVSGTDRLIVRGVSEGLSFFHIPNNQIIGSDELLVSSNQGEEDGLEYIYTNEDEVVLAGEFIIKNLKMNKVTNIIQEIGMQPVLSFGNSSGDYSMANYVINDNPYRSLAFMLCCDDTVRENGNIEKANKMLEACKENNWIPISMKNDWKTIYGDEVTRK